MNYTSSIVLSNGGYLLKRDKEKIEVKKRSLKGEAGHDCCLSVSARLS